MKYFSKLIFVLSFFYLLGCGDDNITNNNNGNGNPNYTVGAMIYSHDSLWVRTTDTSNVFVYSDIVSDTTIEGFKITFTGSTNSDSSYMQLNMFYIDSLNAQWYSWSKTGKSAINQNYELIIDARGYSRYGIGYALYIPNYPRFLSMKNIKVYRITYN